MVEDYYYPTKLPDAKQGGAAANSSWTRLNEELSIATAVSAV